MHRRRDWLVTAALKRREAERASDVERANDEPVRWCAACHVQKLRSDNRTGVCQACWRDHASGRLCAAGCNTVLDVRNSEGTLCGSKDCDRFIARRDRLRGEALAEVRALGPDVLSRLSPQALATIRDIPQGS
jgi:hypothetical protein